MADSDSSSGASAPPDAKEKDEWPLRSRFRKKFLPYGVRVCEETLDEIQGYNDCTVIPESETVYGPLAVQIETREGVLEADPGDWIMEDSEGHHYPIAHEELRTTYEPVLGSGPDDT